MGTERNRAWRAANPELSSQLLREYNLRNKYGMTIADYARMLQEQEGRCAICGSDSPRGRYANFAVDHDHETGQVRGLLCYPCNVGLGNYGDDPELLQRAIDYLVQHAG